MAFTFFGVHAPTVPPGASFEVGVFVNSEGQVMNAISGDVVLPAGLDSAEIMNGGSLVSLWLVPPKLVDGRIHFEGVIPGGLVSSQLPLFSVVLTPATVGNLELRTENIHVYKHDGLGTELPVKEGKITLSVKTGAAASPEIAKDVTPPETFTPVFIRDPNIANGKLAVAFATLDTGSGISSYEVRESGGLFSSDYFMPDVQSPYVLGLGSWPSGKIEIIAGDHAGNLRTVTVQRPLDQSAKIFFGGCILALLVIAVTLAMILRRRLWRKQKSSRLR